MSTLIGTAPDQVPVNGMLGGMAFQDSASVKVTDLTTAGNLRVSGRLEIGTASGPDSTFTIGGTYTAASGYAYVSRLIGTIPSTATSGAILHQSEISTTAASFTLPFVYHYQASQNTIGAGSAITTQRGIQVEPNLIGATNNHGFFGGIAAGTGRYNLYMGGTADNYLAGNLGIGGNAAGNTLVIAKAITGNASARSVWASATVLSDVTTNAFGFATNISTQSAAFTLPTLVHVYSNQSTLGAGSIISNQYGVLAEAGLIGATNNFGLYGNIPAATAGTTNVATIASISCAGTTATITTTVAHGYTTGQTVTITATANATALVTGALVTILTVGTTDYTLIGAANNNIGTSFTATAAGTGTGTVTMNCQGSGRAVASPSGSVFTIVCSSATYVPVTILTGAVQVSTRYNLYMSGTAPNYMAGSLGVGASIPSTKLHVRSDADALTVIGQIQNRNAGANAGGVIAFINSGTDLVDNRYSYIGAVTGAAGQNGNNLVFASNANGQAAVERMRIDTVGNVGIGTTANTSAILDAQSTTKGVRFPNMTTTQKTAVVTPAAGLVVFDTTLAKLCVYTGAAWQTITST